MKRVNPLLEVVVTVTIVTYMLSADAGEAEQRLAWRM